MPVTLNFTYIMVAQGQTIWNFKNSAVNADRNFWGMPGYACKCPKNANVQIFWYSLHFVNILFAYVWYFSEFLASGGILSILSKWTRE